MAESNRNEKERIYVKTLKTCSFSFTIAVASVLLRTSLIMKYPCVMCVCVSLNQTKTSGTQVTDFLFAFEIHVHYICDEQKNMLSMIVSYIYNVIEFYQFTTALDVSINLCHVHFIHSKCSRPPNMLLFVLGFNRDTRLKVVANNVHAFMRYN